jgi:ABC-type transport system substrate-binding protein
MVRNTGITAIGAPTDIPTQTNTYPLSAPITETLILVDAQDRIVPQLAKSVDISADGKTVTFNLQHGVKFHDGTDFNAAAVKYNLEAVHNAKVSGAAVLDNVASYEVVDDYTLRVHLNTYDASFLMSLAQSGIGVMVSPTALAKPTTPENAGKDHLIGTGPFMFDSWAVGQYIRMKRNPNYWQPGRPYLDTIEVRSNTDITTSLMSFKAGEVDSVENLDPAQYLELQSQGYQVGIPPGLAFVFSFRTDNATASSPFAKQQVREALWYAVDRQGLVQGLGKGTYNVANQLASPNQGWYIQDYPNRPYDPAKAKQLLAEAGYPNGFKTTLHYDVRGRQDDIIALQNYFSAIGIQTDLDIADVARSTTFATDGFDGILQGGFPNWSTFTSWMNVWLNPTLTYPTVAFPAGWIDGWKAVKAEPDYDKRMADMKALLKECYDQAIVIPWMWDSPRYVMNKNMMDVSWDAIDINGYFDAVNAWKKH